MTSRRFTLGLTLFLFALLGSFAISHASRASKLKTVKAAAPTTAVAVVDVQPEDVPIYAEYAAQTYARDLVEVRGRVTGFIEKRLFQIGSDVKAGQVLYQLDLRPYEAAVAKAKADLEQSTANVAQAGANLLKAKQDVERLEPLVKERAAPQQDLDNALTASKAAQASVNAAQAQIGSNQALLRTAQLNLEYATITAPVGGRIGDTLDPVGGLVTATSAQPLTTIVPLDPIWVRFKVSEAEVLDRENSWNGAQRSRQPLQLVLADNNVHPQTGRFANALNQVDAKTGTLEIQAAFPNPQHTVLPGQFGRVRIVSSQKKDALLV